MKIIIKKQQLKKIIEGIANAKKFKIESIVMEKGQQAFIQDNNLILEWEQYKKIPKTNLTYRYDKGQGRDGMQDHMHVYYDNSKNQAYAINRNGSPHDGSKARLGKKEINFLKSKGFNPPENGILEWITLPEDKEYVEYKVRFLLNE